MISPAQASSIPVWLTDTVLKESKQIQQQQQEHRGHTPIIMESEPHHGVEVSPT